MAKRDYSSWSQGELIEEINKLNSRKRFGLVWEEKPEATAQQLEDHIPLVSEVEERRLGDPNSEKTNLIIEGDNLHALSLLQFTHSNQIDVIYIDPPYNRGGDFRYNDDYVDKEDSYRHSKWLSFMSKRLILAKDLLPDHGVIFISIDDVEHAKLRLLCDEIFGEKNVIADISVVNNLKGRSDDAHFATAHEFLIVCAKDHAKVSIGGFALDQSQVEEYKFSDDKGPYKPVGLQKTGKQSLRADRPNMFYPIYWDEATNTLSLERGNATDFEIFPTFTDGREGRWRWGKETFDTRKDSELIVKKQKRGPVLYVKMRLNDIDDEERTLAPKSIWIDPKYDSGSATKMLDKMFKAKAFPNPKPVPFLEDVLRISTTPESTVLDFFAGSGSTGHAVLSLNEADKGTRKFILCTNNEENIAEEVCYARLRHVINGYSPSEAEHVKGLGGDLRYFKLEQVPSRMTDAAKKRISGQISSVIAIKEGAFETLKATEEYVLLSAFHKRVLIVADADFIESAKIEIVKQPELDFTVYVFSLGSELFEEEFFEFGSRVTVKPIPDALIHSFTRVRRQLAGRK